MIKAIKISLYEKVSASSTPWIMVSLGSPKASINMIEGVSQQIQASVDEIMFELANKESKESDQYSPIM